MSRHTKHFIIITIALCIALLVYSLSRQADSVYFLPYWLSFNRTDAGSGIITNCLPSLIHVYVFILLSAVFSVPSITRLIPLCVFWFVLESLLEIAQLNWIAASIAAHTPASFMDIPLLENIDDYFLLGTFDALDIGFSFIGTVLAYLTFIWLYGDVENDASS